MMGRTNAMMAGSPTPPAPEPTALCFTSVEDGSTISHHVTGTVDTTGIKYTTDKLTWIDWSNGETLTVNKDGKIWIKNERETLSTDASNYFSFKCTGGFYMSGNVNSMIGGLSPYAYCFIFMFETYGIFSAAELNVGTYAGERCFYQMFFKCRELVKAPQLPATNVGTFAYFGMFERCISLTEPPDLRHLVSVGRRGCAYMFKSCRNLQVYQDSSETTRYPFFAPVSAGDESYDEMFFGGGGEIDGTPEPGHTYYYVGEVEDW